MTEDDLVSLTVLKWVVAVLVVLIFAAIGWLAMRYVSQ